MAVTVHGPDGDRLQVLTVRQLEDAPGLIPSASYTTRSAGGRESSDTYPDVLPVRSLLQVLGIPVDAVTGTSTSDRIGRASTLSARDLEDPSAADFPFADGALPAVYYGGAGAMGYLRPLRGPGDTNDHEVFQELDDAPVPVEVYLTGHVLAPTVHPSTTTTKTGSPVTFTVDFATPPGTTVTSYAWDFGDGRTASGAHPSHTFTSGGTFAVSVAVAGQDGSRGQSTPVSVVVGKPTTPTHGPTRPGGGDSTSPHAPATGPRQGSGNRAGTSTRQGGSGTAAGSDGRAGGASSAGPTARQVPATSQPAPRTPAPRRRSTPPVPAGLPKVEGVVLTAATSPSAASTRSSRASAPAQRRASASGVPTAVLGVAGVLALLATGACSELGGPRAAARRLRGARRLRAPGGLQ